MEKPQPEATAEPRAPPTPQKNLQEIIQKSNSKRYLIVPTNDVKNALPLPPSYPFEADETDHWFSVRIMQYYPIGLTRDLAHVSVVPSMVFGGRHLCRLKTCKRSSKWKVCELPRSKIPSSARLQFSFISTEGNVKRTVGVISVPWITPRETIDGRVWAPLEGLLSTVLEARPNAKHGSVGDDGQYCAYMKKLGGGFNMGGLKQLFRKRSSSGSKADKLAQSLQRRYFVLEDGVLYWYKDHRQKTVGKSIEMSEVVAVMNPSKLVPKKGMRGFDLKQANGRTMTLVQEESTESQDLADILKMWVNAKGNYKEVAEERILRPQKHVTTIADLSYGYSSFDLARVIIYECKTQTGLTEYDLASQSLASKLSIKSDEKKIGIVRVGTRVRKHSSRRGLTRKNSSRRRTIAATNGPIQRSASFNASPSFSVFVPKQKEEEDTETKIDWSKPVLLTLDKTTGQLSWYSFDKTGQKKTCLETINVKGATVRRSRQSEERQRPPIRSERRSEVREDYSRGGFVIINNKTGRMTYFCVCSLDEKDAVEIVNMLKVSSDTIHDCICYDDRRLFSKPEQLRVEWINELEATIKKGAMVPPQADELHVCTEVLRKDLLQKLTEGEKAIVWRYREAQPVAYTYWLHALLSVVNWSERDQVTELHRVLKTYPRDFELHKHQVISPLMLLTEACPDAEVRHYAVECLRKMELSSHQMRFWMPEFVQSLKSEILHWSCSPLLRYLQSNIQTLPAALALFWQLKVETRSLHYKRMEAILNEVRKGFSDPDVLDEQERLWGEQGVFANISRACYKLAKGISNTGEVKIFSGKLRKRALKSGRKWARRDFVLYPGKLCYYKDVMHNKTPTGTYELTAESTISNGEKENCMIVTGSFEDPPLYIVAANHRMKQDWEKAIKGEIKRIRAEFNEHTAMLDPLPLHKILQLLEHNEIDQKFTRLMVVHQNPFVDESDKTDEPQTRYQLLVRGDHNTWSRERLFILQGKASDFQKISLKDQVAGESASADGGLKRVNSSRKSTETTWLGQTLPRVKVIFKVGDDLRQDALVLQSLRLFQHLWEDEGLVAPLTPYPAVSTWTDGGMIGVVPDSATLADIQTQYGGMFFGAFADSPIRKYLMEHNPTESSYKRAQKRFTHSLAGYCVATCVLGIGDRHNDNIMITKDGRLFHIDFGHILGNFKLFKKKIKREKTLFVFTQAMAAVVSSIGDGTGRNIEQFADICARAFLVLRANSEMILGMFSSMVAAMLPELNTADHIEYIRAMLHLEDTDAEAQEWFKEELQTSVNDFQKGIDNTIHILLHKQRKASGQALHDLCHKLIEEADFNDTFLLPTGETVGRIVTEECRVLSSAAKPLLLSFEVPLSAIQPEVEITDMMPNKNNKSKTGKSSRLRVGPGGVLSLYEAVSMAQNEMFWEMKVFMSAEKSANPDTTYPDLKSMVIERFGLNHFMRYTKELEEHFDQVTEKIRKSANHTGLTPIKNKILEQPHRRTPPRHTGPESRNDSIASVASSRNESLSSVSSKASASSRTRKMAMSMDQPPAIAANKLPPPLPDSPKPRTRVKSTKYLPLRLPRNSAPERMSLDVERSASLPIMSELGRGRSHGFTMQDGGVATNASAFSPPPPHDADVNSDEGSTDDASYSSHSYQAPPSPPPSPSSDSPVLEPTLADMISPSSSAAPASFDLSDSTSCSTLGTPTPRPTPPTPKPRPPPPKSKSKTPKPKPPPPRPKPIPLEAPVDALSTLPPAPPTPHDSSSTSLSTTGTPTPKPPPTPPKSKPAPPPKASKAKPPVPPIPSSTKKQKKSTLVSSPSSKKVPPPPCRSRKPDLVSPRSLSASESELADKI